MTTDTGPRLSGWCTPAPGMRHTEYEHAACRPALGCECEAFGGHGNRLVERDSGLGHVESDVQSGPESALTDRGLRPDPVREL